VALYELGHALGLGHYTYAHFTGFRYACDKGTENYDIMNHIMPYAKRGEPMPDLSESDKCAFKLLYCPDLVVLNIYEYQPQTQIVYPNPGKYVVNFEFELPRYTENLQMTVKDVLGQTVLTVLNNAVKESGKHTMLINVDGLAVGTYYIIIEAGAYRTAQLIMIVR